MNQITIWSRKDENSNEYYHNHIEENWVEGAYPNPIKPEFTKQENWRKNEWKKEFGFIDTNGTVQRSV